MKSLTWMRSGLVALALVGLSCSPMTLADEEKATSHPAEAEAVETGSKMEKAPATACPACRLAMKAAESKNEPKTAMCKACAMKHGKAKAAMEAMHGEMGEKKAHSKMAKGGCPACRMKAETANAEGKSEAAHLCARCSMKAAAEEGQMPGHAHHARQGMGKAKKNCCGGCGGCPMKRAAAKAEAMTMDEKAPGEAAPAEKMAPKTEAPMEETKETASDMQKPEAKEMMEKKSRQTMSTNPKPEANRPAANATGCSGCAMRM